MVTFERARMLGQLSRGIDPSAIPADLYLARSISARYAEDAETETRNPTVLGRAEAVLINIFTLIEYVGGLGFGSYPELSTRRTTRYLRLARALDRGGEIPEEIRRDYEKTISGRLILWTAENIR